MTTAPQEESWFDAPARVSWRAYGLALLPLAAAGWLPWWSTALLCGLFGLAVRWPRWEEGRLLLSLLIVGVAAVTLAPAALAGGRAALVGLALHYLALFFVALALNWSAGRISDAVRRGRAALLAPLLIGLLAPQPGLLLALAGGLLATEGRDERMGQRPQRPVSRVWWAAGAALALTLLLSLVLPRQTVNWAALGGPSTPVQTQRAPPNQTAPRSLPQTRPAASQPGVELPFQFSIRGVYLPTDAILLGGLLLLLAGGSLLFRLRRAERKIRPLELLMVAGLILTGALWLAAGVLLSGGGQGGSGGAVQQAPAGRPNALAEFLSNISGRRLIDISAFVQTLLWLSLMVLFAFAALLFWLNFTQSKPKEFEGEVREKLEADPAAPLQPALHRVRLAYRQAEEALRQHGRGRMAAETPAGYAARLSGFDAALAGPLDTLTRAYAPVRYGGRVTDEDAAQAEAAARELAEVLPGLPLPHDLPDDAPDSLSDKDNP